MRRRGTLRSGEESDWKRHVLSEEEEELIICAECRLEDTKLKGRLYLLKQFVLFCANDQLIEKVHIKQQLLHVEDGKKAISFLLVGGKVLQFGQFSNPKRKVVMQAIEQHLSPAYRKQLQSLFGCIFRKDHMGLEALLEWKGLGRELVREKDMNGYLPIHVAIQQGQFEMVKAMVAYYEGQGEDLGLIVDDYDFNILHTACLEKSNDRILRYLLSLDIDVNKQNKDGNTALHYFCKSFIAPSCSDILELFAAKKVNVNLLNHSQESAMHKAVLNKSIRLMLLNFLIELGGDTNVKNSRGEVPLHYAIRMGRVDVVSTLVEAGADFLSPASDGKTPLELAVESQLDSVQEYLQDAIEYLSWFKGCVRGREEELLLFKWLMEEGFTRERIGSMKMLAFVTLTTHLEGKFLAHGKGHHFDKDQFERSVEDMKNRGKLQREVLQEASMLNRTDTIALRKTLEKEISEAMDGSDLEEGQGFILKYEELEFTKKLGEGASGKVYKGIYKGRAVAVKVLQKTDDMDGEGPVDELITECSTLLRVSRSAEIVDFLGVCVEPAICLVMEYCEKGALNDVLRAGYALTWPVIIAWLRSACKGLAALHAFTPPIIHRDLKTANLLLTGDDRVLVSDFGMAMKEGKGSKETGEEAKGTLAYLAPECMQGVPSSTHSDVYALGIVAWELVHTLLTGVYEVPYIHEGFAYEVQLIVAVGEGLRPKIPAGTPEEMKKLIEEMWAPDPSKRPSPAKIAKRLRAIKRSL